MTDENKKDWKQLQRKVFTRWINVKLRTGQSKLQIDEKELITTWQDGVKLHEFLKVLSHQDSHEKIKEGLTARIQKVDQVKRVLDFAWKVGVKIELKPSVENIIDGAEIQIMGFIWAIMRSFLKIGDGSDERLSAQDALLMWVRNTTAGYPGVDVKNFTKSWHDGLAFCALIHKFRPKLIGDWNSLNASNGVANIKKAMEAATAWWGMEQYLEPGDIEILDDKSMVIYVSEWYFGITGQKDVFLAANRIGKLIDYTEKNDQMKNEYNERAAKLKAEVIQARSLLETPSIDNLENAKERMEAFNTFARDKKAGLTDEFLSVENHFNELAMRLADQHRPEFKPAEGLSIPELRQDFVYLDQQTQAVKSAWHNIKMRLEHRFGVAANDFARWLKYVTSEADTTVFGFTLEEMQAYDLDGADGKVLEEMKTRSQTCNEAYAVLRDLGVTHNRFSGETPESLAALMQGLQDGLAHRRKRHGEEVSEKQNIDNLCKEFANLANPFTKQVEGAKDQITNSQAELDAQLATVVAAIGSAPAEHKSSLAALQQAQSKIDAHGTNLNFYTLYTLADCEVLSKQFLVFLAHKKTMLEDLIERKKMRGVTKEQYALFQKQFKEFDKNGNGHLDANELKQCLFSLGESRKKEEVEAVMKQYGDGKEILFDGYVEFMVNTVGDKSTKEDTVAGFLKITKGEEAARMENLSDVFDEKQLNYIRNTAPRTADGRIDFKAWVDQMFSR